MSLWESAKSYVRGTELLFEWFGKGVPVEQDLAERRALVCSKCPKNDPGYKPVEQVSKAVKELVGFKNHLSLTTPYDNQIFTCSACLCPVSTKIWVDLQRLLRYTDSEEQGQMEKVQCWLTTERDNQQHAISL